MGTDKRQRQKSGRQARIAAAEAAKRKADQRRRLMVLVGSGVAVILAIALVLALSKDKKTTTTTAAGDSSSSTSTPDSTQAALPSAKDKPCVAVSDPLPAGAPDVPVKVGPPPTTLVVEDLKPGTGAVVAATDTVTVNYIGVSCSTGKIFDSSYSRNQPATFPLNGVIQGWTDGLTGMKVGGQRLLGIPSSEAYKDSGSPPLIAPDEALWFVVEVTAATPASATTTTPADAGATTTVPADSGATTTAPATTAAP